MKKLAFSSLILFLLFSIIVTPTLLAQDKITMWVRTPETLDILKDSAQKFMEQNPEKEIEIVEFSADAYPGALQAAISGNNLPDVFHTHNSVPLSRLHSLEKIQPIESYFTNGFLNQFEPATWWEGSTTINDVIYAWPDRSFRRASLFMYYNKDIMKEAGLDPENPPTTWDEFIEQGKQVSEWGDKEIYGLHLGFTSGWFNERIILQLATTVSDDTGVPAEHLPGRMVNWRTGDMFDHEEIIPVIEFFEELEENNVIHPNYFSTQRSQAAAQWAAGQSAFLFDGSWRLSEILKKYTDMNFGITMLPAKQGDTAYWGVAGGSQNAFVVSKSSENVELAVEFFEYLTENYYPLLLENAIDLSPVPEINNNEDNYVYPEFKKLVDLTYQGTKVLPSPVKANPDELTTVTILSGLNSRRPFGPTIQGYLSGENMDIEKYLADYAVEQNEFLMEALEEATEEGADVSKENWIFEDWDKTEDYEQ